MDNGRLADRAREAVASMRRLGERVWRAVQGDINAPEPPENELVGIVRGYAPTMRPLVTPQAAAPATPPAAPTLDPAANLPTDPPTPAE